MLSSQPHYSTPLQNADAIFCLPWSTIIAVWLESFSEDLFIQAWCATSGHRHSHWELKSEKKKKKKSQVLSKQAPQVSVLTGPLWLDGHLENITSGTLECAQSRSFARNGESSLPCNGLCVDWCCFACCTSLTHFQNGSRAGGFKRCWVKNWTWGENTDALGGCVLNTECTVG